MPDKTQEISVKVENGGDSLNYEDMQYLINKVKDSTLIIHRIASVTKNTHDNQHSIREALATIKDLTAHFLEQK